jgi:hypothetical protein
MPVGELLRIGALQQRNAPTGCMDTPTVTNLRVQAVAQAAFARPGMVMALYRIEGSEKTSSLFSSSSFGTWGAACLRPLFFLEFRDVGVH